MGRLRDRWIRWLASDPAIRMAVQNSTLFDRMRAHAYAMRDRGEFSLEGWGGVSEFIASFEASEKGERRNEGHG